MRYVLALILAVSAMAGTTTISDAIYDGSGNLWNGTVTAVCDGVDAQSVKVSSGALSIALTDDAQGRRCTVTYRSTDASVAAWTETWYVYPSADSITPAEARSRSNFLAKHGTGATQTAAVSASSLWVGVAYAAPATAGVAHIGAALTLTPQHKSALPACASGTKGTIAVIDDSDTQTWGAAITGSSSSVVLAYCNGTSYTVAGK